jgi:hypothetical protein
MVRFLRSTNFDWQRAALLYNYHQVLLLLRLRLLLSHLFVQQ